MKNATKSWPLFPGSEHAPAQGSGQGAMGARDAKTLRVPTGCQQMTNLLTYNCRTLLGEAKLEELNTELDYINWDIVGLSEVRLLGENPIKLKNGHIFYHKGNEQTRYGGVRFLINKKLEKTNR